MTPKEFITKLKELIERNEIPYSQNIRLPEPLLNKKIKDIELGGKTVIHNFDSDIINLDLDIEVLNEN